MNERKLKLKVENDLEFKNLIETIKDIHEMEDICTEFKIHLADFSEENKVSYEKINKSYLLSENKIKYHKNRHEDEDLDFQFFAEDYGELKYGWKIVEANLENVRHIESEEESNNHFIFFDDIENYIKNNIQSESIGEENYNFREEVKKINEERELRKIQIDKEYDEKINKIREQTLNRIILKSIGKEDTINESQALIGNVTKINKRIESIVNEEEKITAKDLKLILIKEFGAKVVSDFYNSREKEKIENHARVYIPAIEGQEFYISRKLFLDAFTRNLQRELRNGIDRIPFRKLIPFNLDRKKNSPILSDTLRKENLYVQDGYVIKGE